MFTLVAISHFSNPGAAQSASGEIALLNAAILVNRGVAASVIAPNGEYLWCFAPLPNSSTIDAQIPPSSVGT